MRHVPPNGGTLYRLQWTCDGIDSGATPQARRSGKDSGLERGRILDEAERLERTVKVLREIALPELAKTSRPVVKKH